jgi:hypothetical protein
MDPADLHALVPVIAEQLALPAVPADWGGCDAVWPLLERMRQDGAVVLVKLDGGRTTGKTGAYTVLASGGLLDEEHTVRTDSRSLEAGLAWVIVGYARDGWKLDGL